MTKETRGAAEKGERSIVAVLGTLGMVASPMLLVMGLLYGFGELASNRVTGVMGLVFVVGWMCSVVGIRLTRATGEGAAGKILFLIQIVGLVLAGSQQVQEIIFEQPEANGLIYVIADIAWPVSMLLMLVVGGFILKAGVWRGWRRWTALLCGLALPASIAVGAVARREAGIFLFGLITTVGFMLLGNAVRTSDRVAATNVER